MFKNLCWVMAGVCVVCPLAYADFVAYNDFGGTSAGNVTAFTLSQSGLLKDYSTGANTSVTLNVVTGSPAPATDGSTGSTPTGGDAFNIFNGKINMAGYIWYNNVITVPYSNCRLDFTGLDPNKTYEIVLSANRDNSAYVARNTQFVISDVSAFTNSHSNGTVTYTTTTTNDSVKFNTGYNTLNGYVARWTGIKSGPDGDFSVSVTAAPASGNANDDGRWYLGGMRLSEASYDFQQGLNGYNGTVDTFLHAATPTTDNSATNQIRWDGDDLGGQVFALIRFDNIFGNGAGQIPAGSTVTSATLTYNVTNSGDVGTVREVAIPWSETDTYNTFGGDAGVQADEYGNVIGTSTGYLGSNVFDVTSSLAAWSNNTGANRGWIVLPTAVDGVQFSSKEDATVALRPRLSVVATPGAGGGTTLTLQDGLNGYIDTVDTFLQQINPNTNLGSTTPLKWDTDDGGGFDYTLIRFNNIFGTGAGQIQPTDTITSATLYYTVGGDANAIGNDATVHEVLVNWVESDTFNTFGGEPDVQPDEYGASSLGTAAGGVLGQASVNVTSSLIAWQANGSPNTANRGWIIRPTGTDGVQVRSREYATTQSERPKLVVLLNGGAPAVKTLFVKYQPYLQLGNAPLQSTGAGIGTTDQMVIAWQTVEAGSGTAPNDYFEVEYRRVGDVSYIPVTPVNVLNTGEQTRLNHSVTITGLNYDDDYEYHVTHKRNPSSPITVTTYNGTFHTRKPPSSTTSFSFAAYGDSADKYSGELPQAESVNSRIATLQLPFVMLLGDNIYPSGTHDDMDARFETAIVPINSAYIRNHIQYFCMGNHDNTYNSGRPSLDDFYCPIPVLGVTSPVAAPVGETAEKNYSFDYGIVHFTVIDSCAWGGPGNSTSRQSAIVNWMAADLAASSQPWKIVTAHHPPKSYFGHSDTGDAMACEVFPPMIANGADMLLVGHSHDYQRSFPILSHSGAPACTGGDVTYTADQSGAYLKGAQVIEVLAGTGGKNIDGPAPTSATQWLAKAFGNNNGGEVGPLVIDVTSSQLTITYMTASTGAVRDQFTITAPGPLITTSTTAISRTVFIGDSLSNDTFTVRNGGTGTINYTINDDVAWLNVSPTSGSSTGENDPIDVIYDVASLPGGTYPATITIAAPGAINTPKLISVTVDVVGVRPDFDVDGDVDQVDFGHWQKCASGPGLPYGAGCQKADLDLVPDGDVDVADLAVFLACQSGPNIIAIRTCDD